MEKIADLLGGRIEISVGSITEFAGDALVNAANSGLLGGGGVDGAIHAAAGPELLAECRKLRSGALKDGLPAGKAVATAPGRLAVKAVVHAVGPIWRDGAHGEPELLASCYREALALAGGKRYRSIAFPAISTGVYGYPKPLAARVAEAAIRGFLAQNSLPEKVHLIFYSKHDAEIFISAL